MEIFLIKLRRYSNKVRIYGAGNSLAVTAIIVLTVLICSCGSKPSVDKDQAAMARADKLMHEKNYQGALKEYRSVFKHHNKNPRLYRSIAECFENLGELDSAITYYEGAIVFRPTDSDAYQRIGDIYYKRVMYHEAMTWYDRARDLGYLKPHSYVRLGDIHFRWREYDQAREYYGLATTLDSTNTDGFYGLGLTALAVQDTALAIAYLRKAAEADHAGTAFILGQLYFEKEDLDEAEKWFDICLQLQPESGLALKAAEYKIRIDLLKQAGKAGAK